MELEVAPHGTIEVIALPPSGALTSSRTGHWGYLPELSLIAAVGLFMVALGYTGSRVSADWAQPLFWLGLVVIFAPIMARLFVLRTPDRRERLGLLLVLELLLYFVRVLQYPLAFAQFDEAAHWRTAMDIAATGHLFGDNPLLPISSIYPGLEIATNAVSSLTGLSIYMSGRIVVGAAHILLVLALYLFLERVTSSPHLAGIATALYMTNPHYVFFDAQFAYESVALPLAIFVLFVAARAIHLHESLRIRLGFMGAAIVGVWTVVITHHLTSYALMGFLLLWMLASLLRSRRTWDPFSLGLYVLLGLASVVFWLIYTQFRALGYLGPVVVGATEQFQMILAGEAATRQLFHDYSGAVTPLWQRVVASGSVGLILIGLVPGLYWIWRNRVNAATLALAAWALVYIPSQALRLSQAGIEVADRATEFVFLGIALVLAITATQFPLPFPRLLRPLIRPFARLFTRLFARPLAHPRIRLLAHPLTVAALTIGATTLFIGAVVAGSGPDWDRFPGPFLVSADSRSITHEGISSAQWANTYLGPGQRVATDRVNTMLMLTYGDQRVVTSIDDHLDPSPIFTSTTFDAEDLGLVRSARIHYLVVDQRMSTGLPRLGFYFSEDEPDAFNYSTPISREALTKFDEMSNVSRIFDSGDIVIYDTGALLNGP